MTPLFPPPTTFAEGQRAVALWLASAGGIFLGLGLAVIVWIFWRGGWTDASEAQRITAISIISIGTLFGLIAVIIGLLVGGPVGRFKAGVSRDGATFETEDKDG